MTSRTVSCVLKYMLFFIALPQLMVRLYSKYIWGYSETLRSPSYHYDAA